MTVVPLSLCFDSHKEHACWKKNFPACLLNKLLVTLHFHYFITIYATASQELTVKQHQSLELASHFYSFGFYGT